MCRVISFLNGMLFHLYGLQLCCVLTDGYTDNCSSDNEGFPLFIEKYEGEINLRVHANINVEDPTHCVPLTGARNENRVLD